MVMLIVVVQGEEGYKGYAKEIMQTATYLRDEISNIPDLFILGIYLNLLVCRLFLIW